MDRICNEALLRKVTTPRAAAAHIKNGMTVGFSGFTVIGYPKVLPAELARRAEEGEELGITVITGGNVGDQLDGVLARSGVMKRRYGFQGNRDLRALANADRIQYVDTHVSHGPYLIKNGYLGKIDVAVIEVAAIRADGSLVLPFSVGIDDTLVKYADKLILEVNEAIPLEVEGMHDILTLERAPHTQAIEIFKPDDRVGSPYLPCDPDKVAAVILTNCEDTNQDLPAPTPDMEAIASHIVKFLQSEVAAGRLPNPLPPMQSGVGGVANAVLSALARSVPYETIAEKLHAQKGYKVGVISTVNIDHATPAAFYAHQKTRKNYYQIGVELANSGFEYFAGGEFQKVNGDGTGPDNHTVAANAGYNVVTTQAGAAALTAGAGKTLIIAENLGDGKAMNYAMDAANGEWQLTDYVKKGIELLNNKKGFFLMTESGKIDWACHANDAAASIHDVLEMSNAVQAAVDFYNAHPNETLILVTADHETGGMAIGYKTTNYDTFLTNLAHQKMSYAKFDSTYVQGYIANKTPFETAMQDVKNVFGLTLPTDPAAASAGKLLLTDYEAENLRKAYERTLQVGSSSQSKMSQQDYELYGTYIPFSMAVCHTINHKSGMDHTTYAHTGAMVNVYAMGVGAEKFGGVYDNTEIYHKLAELTKVQ